MYLIEEVICATHATPCAQAAPLSDDTDYRTPAGHTFGCPSSCNACSQPAIPQIQVHSHTPLGSPSTPTRVRLLNRFVDTLLSESILLRKRNKLKLSLCIAFAVLSRLKDSCSPEDTSSEGTKDSNYVVCSEVDGAGETVYYIAHNPMRTAGGRTAVEAFR